MTITGEWREFFNGNVVGFRTFNLESHEKDSQANFSRLYIFRNWKDDLTYVHSFTIKYTFLKEILQLKLGFNEELLVLKPLNKVRKLQFNNFLMRHFTTSNYGVEVSNYISTARFIRNANVSAYTFAYLSILKLEYATLK